MPFVAQHLRLTNSGKLPDAFLTSKVQSPTDLADAKLGKLYFVLQIDCPWNQVSALGSSIVNIVGREYFRQEGNVPLENFERALAKANRMIEQLRKEGDTSCEQLHALVALAVGDELHLAYTGAAEAYFVRDNHIDLITEPGNQKSDESQIFANVITGEISAGDVVLLGSPTLYSHFTTEDLGRILNQPIVDAGKVIARQLKSAKVRNVNAIILQFNTLKSLEEKTLSDTRETIYIDQPIDSTWSIVQYYFKKVGQPVGKGAKTLAVATGDVSKKAWHKTKQTHKELIVPQTKKILEKSGQASGQAVTQLGQKALPKLGRLGQTFSKIKPEKLSLPHLKEAETVKVHHYTARSRANIWRSILSAPLGLLQELGKQFRAAVQRSPRTWYIIIALLLLASIGASVQSRKAKHGDQPVVTAASLNELKQLVSSASQAKAYGNNDKARQTLAEIVTKAEKVKENPKFAEEAGKILGAAQRDLDSLASASRLSATNSLISIPEQANLGLVAEGVLYYTTNDGKLKQMQLTGGQATLLSEVTDEQAPNLLALEPTNKTLYLQTYTGQLYRFPIGTTKLLSVEPQEKQFPVSTGIGFYAGTLYLLDPAENEIWKYTASEDQFAPASAYTKTDNLSLTDGVELSIDGSVFVLRKNGQVSKFTRGNIVSDFKLHGLPAPFDSIKAPLGFSAIEDGTSYYLTDRGTSTIPPRIIEFDKNGKFIHQYFLPTKWQKDIKLIYTNPKSHKAWVLVNKDLYEFTLVQ